jgi:hypothetical protein
MMGIPAGSLRLPMTEMTPENQKKLKGLLEAYGVKLGGKVALKATPVKKTAASMKPGKK